MKKFIIFSFFFFIGLRLFSQESTNNTETTGKGKIVLPDKPIIIEDESKEKIENKEKKTTIPHSSIDSDELSKVQVSKKLKEEIDTKKEEEFSISSLKFSYGMYENFLVNMQLGKKITNFNYFVSFLRNTRGSVGKDTNIYFNTERAIDDLYLNMGYEVSEKFAFSFDGGYYNRILGLFTNSINISESKFYIPLKIKMDFASEEFIKASGEIDGQYLNLKHKTMTDYRATNLYEMLIPISVEKIWGTDNFLTGNLLYNLFYSGDIEHSFGISIKDRFPLLSSLALQGGISLFVYSHKSFFWVPELLIFYRFSDKFEIKTGLSGNSDFEKNQLLLRENQIYFTNFMPEEKWDYLAGVYYRPVERVVIACEAEYDYFYSYRNFAFDENLQLYYIKNTTNINIVTINPYINFNYMEDINISLSGKLRVFDYNEILRLNQYEITAKAGYFLRKIGFNIETFLSYIGPKKLKEDWFSQSYWKWGISLSQKAGENLIFECRFNNILNQDIFEEIYLKESGFSFDIGLTFRF
ncbi:MAG: hypothetical protein ACP5QT_02295 [Brevinematia bacterium]